METKSYCQQDKCIYEKVRVTIRDRWFCQPSGEMAGGSPSSNAAVGVAEARPVSGWWRSDFRDRVTDFPPPTFRATLLYQDFENSMGFHQSGLPFFRIPNSVLQSRH